MRDEASGTNVSHALNKQLKGEKEKNRNSLLKLVSNLKFLARQGMAIRGADQDQDSNFHQLNTLRAEDNPALAEWLKRKANRYTSPDIQNEILSLMSHTILRDISRDIQHSKYFAILADETTDISNREQLVICLRWIDCNLDVHEDFLGLYKIDDTGAETISKAILDALLRLNINITKCRGQTYDGASAMSGRKSGVQTRIKEKEPKALFNHCHGHLLNLACSDNIKQIDVMRNALDISYEITKLVKKSPQRDTYLEKLRQVSSSETDSPNPKIRVLCPTRWTVKADALHSIMENYSDLMDLWEWSLSKVKDTEMKARIRGVQAYMPKFEFFFGLSLGEVILRNADNLSSALQAKDISAAESKSVAVKTVKTLKSMRTDECFDLFWEKTTRKAKAKDVQDPVLPRKRKMPARYEIGRATSEYHKDPQSFYRQKYFEALDHITQAISDRFEQEDFQIYSNTEQLLLKCAKGEDYESELASVVEFYGNDFEERNLRCQLQTFKTIFECETSDVVLSDIINFFKGMTKRERLLVEEVLRVLLLVLVMPATNATSERSFSVLRRVKTYLRSTMTQSRLNSLMVLHVHKEHTDNLDLYDVCDDFNFSEHRQTIFGKFK